MMTVHSELSNLIGIVNQHLHTILFLYEMLQKINRSENKLESSPLKINGEIKPLYTSNHVI